MNKEEIKKIFDRNGINGSYSAENCIKELCELSSLPTHKEETKTPTYEEIINKVKNRSEEYQSAFLDCYSYLKQIKVI